MASNCQSNITNMEELRIILVGKTGIGKSAAGNTILGRTCFPSQLSPRSLTTFCAKQTAEVDGRMVAIIDTPGLFDTRFDHEKTAKDLGQCISYASPGPHIFLVVISLGRFTEEEKQTVQKIQEVFGEAADKYSMVLFTHGDRLDGISIEEFLAESPELQELVARCNNQYHVFDNKTMIDKKPQVTSLLLKITNIVEKNGGSHYTNEMFQEAEKAIEEEKQRILKEKEEEIRRAQEEAEQKIRQEYAEKIKKIIEAQAKKEQEELRRKLEEQKERELREQEEMLRAHHKREARREAEERRRRHRHRRQCKSM